MAASKSTVERGLEVILKHVPKETALKILEELMTVPGNKSLAIPSSGCTTVRVNGDRDNPRPKSGVSEQEEVHVAYLDLTWTLKAIDEVARP